MYVTNRIRNESGKAVEWKCARNDIEYAALVVGTRVFNDMVAALWCFSLALAASYIFYMALSYYYAERQPASA